MEGIDFGSFKKGETVATKPVTPTEPPRPRKDYKKMYNSLKTDYQKLQAAFTLSNENNDKLQDESTMLRLQEKHMKDAIDILTIQVEKMKFKPREFSELAQLLTYLRVHGNKQALIRVEEIVGTTELSAVRKYIFDLMERPYI